MSILILERPDKQHLYSGNTSKFNAVHNVVQYKLQRRDYSVLYGIPDTGNFVRVTIPRTQYDECLIEIGDKLYLSSIDKLCDVVNIGFSPAFVFVTLSEQFTSVSGNPGYANNHTKRKSFRLEVKLYTFNNTTNAINLTNTFEVSPDTKGNGYVKVNEYLSKLVNNKNESPYTGTNYNDLNAWCKFYIAYRSVWSGNNNEAFYEDRVNPFLGSNFAVNGSFDLDLNGWDVNNFIWDAGKAKKAGTLSSAYIRPSNFASYPTLAGKKYRITFKTSDTLGTYSSVNTLKLYFSDATFATGTPEVCGLPGPYQFDFIAVNNGDFPTFTCDNFYFASIDDFKIQLVNESLDNTPVYRYVTKSALQIHSKYNSNLALYDTHFDTLNSLIKRAKFICDFLEPTRWAGFPFDIATLFDESMVVSDVKRKEEIYNYSNATGINEYTLTNKKAGEQRIHLFGTYPSDCRKIKIWLEVGDVANDEYVDEEYVEDGYVTVNEGSDPAPAAEEGEVTERRTIRMGQCTDMPVYLSWKGSAGGWSYYMFGKTQAIGLSTSEQSISDPYIENLDVTGNKYQIKISSGESMTMGCNGIDLNDVKGIMRMLDSGCIRMYLGQHEITGLPEWEDVIIKSGSFKIYETGNARHDIEFTVENPNRYTHSA